MSRCQILNALLALQLHFLRLDIAQKKKRDGIICVTDLLHVAQTPRAEIMPNLDFCTGVRMATVAGFATRRFLLSAQYV